MPLVLPPHVAGLHETNVTAASRVGTTITAGTPAGTKSAYATLIDPTDFPSYGIWIAFRNVQVAATLTAILVDIAYGPTGGGSEQLLIPSLSATAAPDNTTECGVKLYYFPIYIPAGVALRARSWSNLALDTVIVSVWLDQNPLLPGPRGRVSVYGEDGTAANARGTAVTPGAGAFGTWTELLHGGVSGIERPHRYWTLAQGMGTDTTLTDNESILAQLGVGPNNTTVSVLGQFQFSEEGNEPIIGPLPLFVYAPMIVDATNAKLWVRTAAAATGNIRDYMAYGID